MKAIAFFISCMISVGAIAAPVGGSDYGNPPNQYAVRVDSTGRQITEASYTVCIDDADIVCKASAGFLHSVSCFGTDAAATAGRVRITNTTAAGGAETTEVWGAEFAAAIQTPISAILDIAMTTGITIDFTTTADVKCVVSYR